MWRILAVLFVPVLVLGSPSPARSQGCACNTLCVKPITISDRWDDVTGIPGYMGDAGSRRSPDWRNNARWDHEAFTDQDNDGLRDASEEYVDANGNGRYDAEAYHPLYTGYGALDVGLEIVLHPGSSIETAALGDYFPVALVPGKRSRGADAYREAWLECEGGPIGLRGPIVALGGQLVGPTNQAMRERIAQDPEATWDGTTNSVQNSRYPVSPRIFLLPVFDPRAPLSNAANHVPVVKVVAFFAEEMVGPAEVRGRFTSIPSADAASVTLHASGFAASRPLPATPGTWGRVKASYR